VTGKWRSSENAEQLLKMDEDDNEAYGDFEDLEDENIKTDEKSSVHGDVGENNLIEKKLKLKEKFDNDYDNKDSKEKNFRITGDHDFYENLKSDAQKQSELNKKEFENIEKDVRIQIEGFRPGLYVRMGKFQRKFNS